MRRFFLVNWKVDNTTLSRMHQAEIKNKKHGSAVKRYRGQKSNGNSKKENEGWQTFWKMKTGMRRTTSE